MIRCIALVGTLTALTACGGADSDSGDNNTPVTPSIKFTFETSLYGQKSTDDNNITIANPSTNNGSFGFTMKANQDYWFSLYLSKDNILSSSDLEFGHGSCIFDSCKTVNEDCSFDSSNTITCGGATEDLTNWLNQLPETAYFIIKSCNQPTDLTADCITKPHAIRFE